MSEADYILPATLNNQQEVRQQMQSYALSKLLEEIHEDAGETLKRDGTLVTLRTALIKVRELKLMRKE